MAELLNTKINGTLNVNDYFNIDENGNLILKLKNDVGDRLTVNSNGLILNTDLKMQSGTAFLNTINTKSTTGIDVQALLQINNSLKINSSASFISDAELVVKNTITTNSLKIKYDESNIILDTNKDGIKLYGNLFVYNGSNDIFTINNNDKTTSIKNAKIPNLSNSEKYLMNYKYYEKTAKAKLANSSSYNKFTLTNGYNDYSSFTKNNKIEIKEDSTGKKLITTIKETEHISGTTTASEKYNIITNDYAVGFAEYSKSLDLTIRKIYDYTMFDIQKNDSSIFNVTGEDVNINKPLTINSDTTINTEYSGITINDAVFDSLFNYDLVLKKPSAYGNVSNDENWYLINNTYSSYNIGSQVKINNIVHDIELRDVYPASMQASIDSNTFANIDGKIGFKYGNNGVIQINNNASKVVTVKESGVNKISITLTSEVSEKLKKTAPYIHFILNDSYINAASTVEIVLVKGKQYSYDISELYEGYLNNSNSTFKSFRFNMYNNAAAAIIFKDNYTYSTGDKIYYREPTSSHNLLNINTRKSNNFLTIKTNNKINVNGELYENNNRVFTKDTALTLFNNRLSVKVVPLNNGTGGIKTVDAEGHDVTDIISASFLFIFPPTKKKIILKKAETDSGYYGIKISFIDGEEISRYEQNNFSFIRGYLTRSIETENSIKRSDYSLILDTSFNQYGINIIKFIKTNSGYNDFKTIVGQFFEEDNDDYNYLFPWGSTKKHFNFTVSSRSNNNEASITVTSDNKKVEMQINLEIESVQIYP